MVGILRKQAASNRAGTSPVVRSRFIALPPEFEGCFTSFYQLELEVDKGELVCDYLQPEWANIRFFRGSRPWVQLGDDHEVEGSDFIATGPSTYTNRFRLGSARMWGIGFLPLGWARFFDVDASSIANLVTDGHSHPAFEKFDPLADILCDTSIDDITKLDLLAKALHSLMRPSRDEARIIRTHRCLLDVKLTSVAQFADEAGVGIRTLERICMRYFGFPPKLLMRRQRFMRSLSTFLLHRGGNWTEAMDEHYHDQAQFTREFQQFMLMKPTEYAALSHPILASFMEARARDWGSPVQTLDSPG